MTLTQTALFLVFVALATGAQALSGFAFALILLGLGGLFDLAPLEDMANVATTLSLASAVAVVRDSRRLVDPMILRNTAIGSFIGIVVGVALLAWLSANVVLLLRLLLGVTVIACAVSVLMKTVALRERSSALAFRAFGTLSGVLSGLFAAAGPPLVYQFYRQPLPLEVLRGTLVTALAIGGVMRVAVVVATGHFSWNALQMCLIAAPLVLLVSTVLHRHPPAWSRQAVLRLVAALLVLTGLGLGIPAALALLAL
jgi:hypothetical protein